MGRCAGRAPRAQRCTTASGPTATGCRFSTAWKPLAPGCFARPGFRSATLVADYAFVRLADLISLAFCAGSTEEQRFDEFTVRLHGTRVVVTPDVFGGAAIPFAIEAKALFSRLFRTDDELRRALWAASTVILRGDVAGRD
jgi:hypothetical protein